MVNTPLLERVLGEIKARPELHDQSGFFTPTECGTAMCFAGWACHLSGLEQVQPGTYCSAVMTPHGVDGAGSAARVALGLTGVQAGILFSPANTVSMLEEMVKDLANGDMRDWEYYRDV